MGEGGTPRDAKSRNGNLGARGFAVGYGFGYAHPDVDEAEAADYAADEAVHQEVLERGIRGQERVVGPEAWSRAARSG